METIRMYLESMFSTLPNHPEVRRAKSELGQMMEDKYNELLQEGKSENEAIGTVIAEFGNLDELAQTLGIETILKGQTSDDRKVMPLDMVRQYLSDCASASLMHGLTAFFGIICASGIIVGGTFSDADPSGGIRPMMWGMIFLFACIAAIIGLSVYSGTMMERWKHLKHSYRVDYASCEYVHQLRESGRSTFTLLKTVGILLCALCFVPVVVIGMMDLSDEAAAFSVVALLFMVGIGVLILTTIDGKEKSYKKILQLNDAGTVGGSYVSSQDEVRSGNGRAKEFMSIYWSTITCIYLIYSFLTFRWFTSWIIWPIAGVISSLLKTIWGIRDKD